MEEEKTTIEELTENIADIGETYYKLAQITVVEKATVIGSVSIVIICYILLALMIIFFGGIGLSMYLNTLLQSTYWGFFIVCGFFVLIALLLFITRNRIVFPLLKNFIVKQVYE